MLFLNITGLLFLLVVPTFFGYTGDLKAMALAIAAGGIFLCFANIDKVAKFKGAGFEAEMRDFLHEANLTLDQLRDHVGPIFAVAFTQMAVANRFRSRAALEDHGNFENLRDAGEKLDLKSTEYIAALNSYLFINAWDLVAEIVNAIAEKYPTEAEEIYSTAKSSLGEHSYEIPPKQKAVAEFVTKYETCAKIQSPLDSFNAFVEKYEL